VRFSSYFTQEERDEAPCLTKFLKHGVKTEVVENSMFLQVKLMVACLTVRMIMKRYLGKCNLRKFYARYYDVISKYSYKRLIHLLKIQPFQIVIVEFFQSPDFEEMLNSDESLLSDKEMYKLKAGRILKVVHELANFNN
jgi:hypothetical protein